MAGYELRIKPSAVKELERIPRRQDRRRVVSRIQGLTANPRPNGCAKLSGQEAYRIRQGSYRVVYSVDDDEQVVRVLKIGHRRDVYR